MGSASEAELIPKKTVSAFVRSANGSSDDGGSSPTLECEIRRVIPMPGLGRKGARGGCGNVRPAPQGVSVFWRSSCIFEIVFYHC